MAKYYHGTGKPYKTLIPYKPDLKHKVGKPGIYVTPYREGATAFAIAKASGKTQVGYTTSKGKFVSGEIKSDLPLRRKGYVHEINSTKAINVAPGEYVITSPTKSSKVRKVRRKDLVTSGWSVKAPSTFSYTVNNLFYNRKVRGKVQRVRKGRRR